MPILPENKKRYPKDWNLRSRFIRFIRAKSKCEFCGVRNYSVGWRDNNGVFFAYPKTQYKNYKQARSFAVQLTKENDHKYIVIVLTVAHLHDHRPEAASFLNLAALCQKCHLDYDKDMHVANAARRRNTNENQLTMFEV